MDLCNRRLGVGMAYRALIAFLFFAFVGSAHAVYRSVTPPPGWSNRAGVFEYVRTAEGMKWVELATYGNGSLGVGGRSVSIPAGMKLASGAARATAFRVFANPWVAGGVMVAEWLAENYMQWNAEKRRWETPDEDAQISTGQEYSTRTPQNQDLEATGYFPTQQKACNASALASDAWSKDMAPHRGVLSSDKLVCTVIQKNDYPYYVSNIKSRGSNCPAGWYITQEGCVQDVPYRDVGQTEFVERMEDKQFSDPLLNELPSDWPMPVQLPIINPVPLPAGPAQPTYIPEGDPVPNPDYNPADPPSTTNQPYVQPGVNIIPRNTTESPWNVDVQPVNRPQETDEANPNVDRDPNGTQTGSGGTGSGGKTPPVPSEKAPPELGLCDQYPGILACEKLDQPTPEALKTKPADFNFQIETGFNGAGVCPPPITVSLGGRQYSFSWQGLCDALVLLNPLILAFAWLSAGFILLGREGV